MTPARRAAWSPASARSASALGVGPEDSGTTPVVTVTVDPDDAVAETSEDNNTLRVRAQMPAVPGPGAAVPCQVV